MRTTPEKLRSVHQPEKQVTASFKPKSKAIITPSLAKRGMHLNFPQLPIKSQTTHPEPQVNQITPQSMQWKFNVLQTENEIGEILKKAKTTHYFTYVSHLHTISYTLKIREQPVSTSKWVPATTQSCI